MEFGNYTLFSNFSFSEEQLGPPSNEEIWTLKFDGSCGTARSRASMVHVSLNEDVPQVRIQDYQ